MERTKFINEIAPYLVNKYVGLTVSRSLAKDLKAEHMTKNPDGTKTPNVDIVKVTEVTVRLGIRYSHIAPVAASIIASGLNGEANLELPWGQWDPECKYLIEHKGNYYLRCTNIYSGDVSELSDTDRSKKRRNRPTSVYYLNGEKISKSALQALGYLKDSYWKDDEKLVWVYNLNDVVDVRQKYIPAH